MNELSEVEVLELVRADRELELDDWADRLLVAQLFEPGAYRHYPLHGLGCPADVGGDCSCRLLAVFSGQRRIVVVDYLCNATHLTLN